VVGFASGVVETRDERERLAVADYRNGVVPELYVTPRWRQRGIARALLEALHEHFRSRGCEAVRIEVFAPNVGARRFYERLGYEERDLFVYRPL
jgi:ribosomal protein S18 acetylase RimI-like enzyme